MQTCAIGVRRSRKEFAGTMYARTSVGPRFWIPMKRRTFLFADLFLFIGPSRPRLQMDVWFCRAQEPMPRGTLLRLEHPETVDLYALPSVPGACFKTSSRTLVQAGHSRFRNKSPLMIL